MPFGLTKVKGGYKVRNKHTGKTYSKKAQTKGKATAQLRALYSRTRGK